MTTLVFNDLLSHLGNTCFSKLDNMSEEHLTFKQTKQNKQKKKYFLYMYLYNFKYPEKNEITMKKEAELDKIE